MNPERGRQWERFLEYSALARAKPTFDAEERDWKLRIAERLQETFRAAREGGEWLELLKKAYRQLSLPPARPRPVRQCASSYRVVRRPGSGRSRVRAAGFGRVR
jgi:hypothetical protein